MCNVVNNAHIQKVNKKRAS